MKRNRAMILIGIIVVASISLLVINQVARWRHEAIMIDGNQDFVEQGWPGRGTVENPYVISGLYITAGYIVVEDGREHSYFHEAGLIINNTDAHFVIQYCFISGPTCVILENVENGVIRFCETSTPTLTGFDDYAIRGYNIHNCSIENNVFGNSLEYSIMLVDGSSNTVSSNTIFFNPLITFPRSKAGIYIYNQSLVNCRSNVISNCDKGIALGGCSGSIDHHWISDNIIDTCRTGISLYGCSNFIVLQNHIHNNTASGIYIMGGHFIGASNNTISYCSGNGITVDYESEDCIISYNQISDNEGNGISFSDLSGCWAINNTILRNGESGMFVENSYVCWIDGNLIEHNDGSGVIFETTAFCKATNNEITNNDGWGIVINDSPTTAESNNTFNGNGLGNVGYNVTIPPLAANSHQIYNATSSSDRIFVEYIAKIVSL